MSDERDALYERVREALPSEEAETLKQLLYPASSQHVSQTGKHNINAQSGTIQHVGDRYGPTPEDIRAIVAELIGSNVIIRETTPVQQAGHHAREIPLPTLSVEPAMVKRLNSRLLTLEEISKSGYLAEPQGAEFSAIKEKLSSIESQNQELELISNDVDRILMQSIQSLTQRLQDLSKSQSDTLLEARSQTCIEQQIQILEDFQKELRAGTLVSRWLKREKGNLTSLLVNHVLETHPQIKSTSSERKLKLFSISVEQFIERLEYCLEWGRLDSLENPTTPIVLEDSAYAEAFEQLVKEFPEHLPKDGRSQLIEYVQHLKNNLESYQHIDIDNS